VAGMAFIDFMASCSNNVFVPEYFSPPYLHLAGLIAVNFIQQMFKKYNIHDSNYEFKGSCTTTYLFIN